MGGYFIGITDKGKRRDKNEDTFIVQELPGKDLLLACVIDGVGGYKGGEVAAAIARDVILKQVKSSSGDIIETLQFAVITANEEIQQQRNSGEANANMACVLTCAIADIKNNKFYYSHVGDTRLYLLRDATLVKISRDHSAVGFLEETGRLSEDDAMRHPRRNEINKALGFETELAEVADYIDTGESPFLPGDIMLLCSDGLSDMIGSASITTILNNKRTLKERAKELIDAANEAGGNDNITAILVENNKQSKKQFALKPTGKKNGANAAASMVNTSAAIQTAPVVKPVNNKLKTFLLWLSLGLSVALSASLYQQSSKATLVSASLSNQSKAKDEQTAQLISRVNDSSRVYAIPAGKSLVISEPILITKDSFHLLGKDVHIIADTNYKGPAFIISSSARQVVLDSLVFENFNTAILVQKNNTEFRHIRFNNCSTPVQYAVSLPDTTLSGRFKDSVFITTQSSKKR